MIGTLVIKGSKELDVSGLKFGIHQIKTLTRGNTDIFIKTTKNWNKID